MFDARAWIVWSLSAVVVTMAAHNPFYTLMVLAAASVVGIVYARPERELSLPLVRIGALILGLSTLFNALMAHTGETVLLRLPEHWFWIGGSITAEAAVMGLGNGLVLLSLLVVFTTLNNAVPSSDLVRLAPRALRDLGIVILIALTYVPETMHQLGRIREAQAIRGHRLRGLRDWQPVLVPLLIGGLERALGLAEAMVARGYGATASTRQPLAVQLALLGGLMASFAGWVLSFWVGRPGWLMMGVGLAIIGALIWHLGRRAPQTHYRPRRWTVGDTGLLGTAVLPLLLALIPLSLIDRAAFAYSPYPQLAWPGFDPLFASALLLLVYPAAIALLRAARKPSAPRQRSGLDWPQRESYDHD